jgi:uncharacterized membrane protein
MPRALYFFRVGAAWTWFTGVLLLMLVFYHGGITLEPEVKWGAGPIALIVAILVLPFLYDQLHKSALGKDPKVFGSICFVLLAIYVCLLHYFGFTYRSYNIHAAALFGTIMAFNVWGRIWPAQQQILRAVKEGTAPDPALVALAGARSRHNTYMSVPLLWGMVNQHTVTTGTSLGIPASLGYVLFLLVTLVGWHLVFQLYKKAGKVKGF